VLTTANFLDQTHAHTELFKGGIHYHATWLHNQCWEASCCLFNTRTSKNIRSL